MSIQKVLVCLLDALFQSLAATVIVFKQASKRSFLDKLRFFIPMYIYFIICFLFVPNQLRFILYIFVTCIILNFALKSSDKRVLLYSFNSEVIVTASEVITCAFLVLCGINSKDIVNNDMCNLLANFLISVLSILIINIKLMQKLISKVLELFDKKRYLLRYFYIFIFLMYLILLKNGFELLMKSNYYINILFVFSAVFVLFILIKNELKYEQVNEQNRQMLNHVTKYEKIITEQGKANHEFKNQLMVIKGYVQISSSKLDDYLDSIVDDIRKTHSSYLISNLNKFPDGGIKGLLYYKLSTMEEEKIKYNITVEEGVKNKLKYFDVNTYKNITKVLGVLLDNAIDSSKKARSKKIIIAVESPRGFVKFKIYNSYKGKIDISMIGTGYTTKGKGHGFGLKLVNDIIESTPGFGIERYLEDGYFVSSFIVATHSKKQTTSNTK